jgi:hypothetical protein
LILLHCYSYKCFTLVSGYVHIVDLVILADILNVPMFETLWGMSEADMSSMYGTYTVNDLQQAAVVVGGGVRAEVSSLTAGVGG